MNNPRNHPLHWSLIRNMTERFTWIDAVDHSVREGFNPPRNALRKERKPYDICFVTSRGRVYRGRVVTMTVYPERHQRLVKFLASGEMRPVRDYLIVSVDEHFFRC